MAKTIQENYISKLKKAYYLSVTMEMANNRHIVKTVPFLQPAWASMQIGALNTCCLAYRPNCDALIRTGIHFTQAWKALSPPSYSPLEHLLSFSHTLTLTTLQLVVSWVTQGGMSSINCGLLKDEMTQNIVFLHISTKRAASKWILASEIQRPEEFKTKQNPRLPETRMKIKMSGL